MSSVGIALDHAIDPTGVCAADFKILLHEADAGAKRLARRLELSANDRDDILHELIVDLLVRGKAFNPSRGRLGAFAGTLVRHRSAHIARRIRRERRFFTEMTTSPTFAGAEDIHLGSPQENAGHADDHLRSETALIESRIDLQRALAELPSTDIRLCGELIDLTPTEISRGSGRSRASIYRAIKKIRTHMVGNGISIAA